MLALLALTAPLIVGAVFGVDAWDRGAWWRSVIRYPRVSLVTLPVLVIGLTSITAGEVFCELYERSGMDAGDVRTSLTDLGVSIADAPVAVAERFPVLRRIDAARRAEQERNGEKAARLSLGDLCVLGCAWITNRPVLTSDQHWSTLAAHGPTVPVYDFCDPSTSL